MPDTTVESTSESNMRDYALWLQEPAGESAVNYSVGDLRMLLAPACPTAGVVGPGDFVVTSSSTPGYVTVSAGVGATAPTGLTGARTRERYLVVADGPVDVPVYANTGSGTRSHRLVVQVNDEQLAMGAAHTVWTYRLIEDTGTPPTSNGINAFALATVKVNAGQGSGYTVVDLRNSCSHQMSCAIEKTSSFDLNVNTETLVQWPSAGEDAGGGDPWHLYDSASNGVRIRDSGLYDLLFVGQFTGLTNGTTSGIELQATIRKNGTALTYGIAKQPPTGIGFSQLRVPVQGEYLVAGDVLTCYTSFLFGTTTSADINGGPCSFRVARREYRP